MNTASGSTQPVKPRLSASLILLREKNQELEVYLMKRNRRSKFMGGMYVFPGGAVTKSDMDIATWSPAIDLELHQIERQANASKMGTEQYLGFCLAGIRETLEEAGILIASSSGNFDQEFKHLEKIRSQPDLSESWFQNEISNTEFKLLLSDLNYWSCWITPERMKIRFKTAFFWVRMPENQTCKPDRRELEKGEWLNIPTALSKSLEGTIPMSPPTLTILLQLMPFSSLEKLAHQQVLKENQGPIMPCAVKSAKGPMVLLPWDPMYNTADKWDSNALPGNLLKPHEKFSRLWNDRGFWKAVDI